jgi:calcineurin-like phosphoesterase family protein
MLIKNWNEVVPKDGVVFHAGDFAFTGNINWIRELTNKLNGRIYLILGNHDYKSRLDREVFKGIFEDVMDVAHFTVKDDEIEEGYLNFFISHYPHMFWKKGFLHLHGHTHSGPNSTASEIVPEHPRRYDIGVDNNNYKPISYNELKILFTKKLGGFK